MPPGTAGSWWPTTRRRSANGVGVASFNCPVSAKNVWETPGIASRSPKWFHTAGMGLFCPTRILQVIDTKSDNLGPLKAQPPSSDQVLISESPDSYIS